VQFLQNADWTAWVVSVLAALFIGISKAGFGGALGLLSTPLCVLAFGPRDAIGIPFGIAAGITSTFAHGAGPVVTMFLVPQRLPKEIFVGTMVLTFTWVNWIKMPFFVGSSIINRQTFELSLLFLPLIPLGVWLGVRLNRTFSEASFLWIIYAITLLAGLQLILDLDLRGLLERVRARTAAPSSLLSAGNREFAMACGFGTPRVAGTARSTAPHSANIPAMRALGSEQLGRHEVFQSGRSQVFALEADDRAFGQAERPLVFQSQQGPDAFGQSRFVAHQQQMLRLRQGAQPGVKAFLRGFVGERVGPLELSGRNCAAAVEHRLGSLAGAHERARIDRVEDYPGFLEESPHSPGLLPSARRERARRVVGAGQRVGVPHEVESHSAINPERPAVSNSLRAGLRYST